MSKPGEGGELEGATERLPFRVSIAAREDMAAVVRLRAASYGRHLPELGAKLAQAEAADFEWGCEVIVATSKLDGSVLGSMRTHSNALKPLPLEASIELPDRYQGGRLVEATRLNVASGGNASLVRQSLFKALYLYGQARQVDWLVVAGRRPVDRIYDGLLFEDVGDCGVFHPMQHAGGIGHRVMSLSVPGAEACWRAAQHPLHAFMCLTRHPDIDLSAARQLGGEWGRQPLSAMRPRQFQLPASPPSRLMTL